MAAAAGIIIGAVLFDSAPDSAKSIGVISTLLLLLVGVVTWAALHSLTRRTRSSTAMIGTVAFWGHSFVEGASVAVSFSLNPRIGMIVLAAVALHLVPEFYALLIALRRFGLTIRQVVSAELVSLGLLLTSFTLFHLFMPGASTTSLSLMTAIIGGGFIYFAGLLLARLKLSVSYVTGLTSGLTIALAWAVLSSQLLHL